MEVVIVLGARDEFLEALDPVTRKGEVLQETDLPSMNRGRGHDQPEQTCDQPFHRSPRRVGNGPNWRASGHKPDVGRASPTSGLRPDARQEDTCSQPI